MSDNDFTRRAFVGTSAALAAAAIEGSRTPAVLGRLGARWRHVRERAAAGIEEVSISELQSGLQSGAYTARSLVEQYFARIDSMDQSGPALNHIIERNPDALMIADQKDTERKSGTKALGPLHGIPILVKDKISEFRRYA